jgi:hypothetical protein
MESEIEIIERKVDVDNFGISYVTAKVKGSMPERTLLLMPSTLGEIFKFI